MRCPGVTPGPWTLKVAVTLPSPPASASEAPLPCTQAPRKTAAAPSSPRARDRRACQAPTASDGSFSKTTGSPRRSSTTSHFAASSASTGACPSGSCSWCASIARAFRCPQTRSKTCIACCVASSGSAAGAGAAALPGRLVAMRRCTTRSPIRSRCSPIASSAAAISLGSPGRRSSARTSAADARVFGSCRTSISITSAASGCALRSHAGTRCVRRRVAMASRRSR
mmetsp:Transcript_16246/g.50439  ORF Transcript_16246/g.50439 Transcript_16246/m.50439 type:complete len:226 (+) Transcript_16246:1853-2530(+)